jgi:hypothetical protein
VTKHSTETKYIHKPPVTKYKTQTVTKTITVKPKPTYHKPGYENPGYGDGGHKKEYKA